MQAKQIGKKSHSNLYSTFFVSFEISAGAEKLFSVKSLSASVGLPNVPQKKRVDHPKVHFSETVLSSESHFGVRVYHQKVVFPETGLSSEI